MPVDGPFLEIIRWLLHPIWTLLPSFGVIIPNAIGYIAISKRYLAIEADVFSVLTSRPEYYHFDPRARPTVTCNCRRARLSPPFDTHMQCFPFRTCVACVLAERSRSATQVLGYRAYDGCRCPLSPSP
eukprot:3704927-Pleurochrysis_carterae.AAC.1